MHFDVSAIVCQFRSGRTCRPASGIQKSAAVRWLALLAFLLVCATGAVAQDSANISGQVLDPSGAAVKEAVVTARNLDTGLERSTTTDDKGRYEIHGLQPGQVEVRAAKQGFSEHTNSAISLAVGQGATADIKLQPKAADVCASGREFATTDCALTFHGVTLYGAYDLGIG